MVAAGAAGVLAALALLALLDALNSGQGFGNTPAATTFGWMIPLVAGVVMAVVAVALLASGSSRDSEKGHNEACACSECGGTVRGEWRLCPHCGARLAESGSARINC